MFANPRSRRVRGALATLQVLLLVLTSTTLLLMQSRGAWFGLAVATVAILMWQTRWTRLLALSVVGVAAIAFAPAIVASVRVGQPGVPLDGMMDRVEIWSGALRGIQETALTGMGMNVFRKFAPVLAPTLAADPGVLMPSHAHNHLLQAALDLGLPGLIAYTSIWLSTAFLLVTSYRRSMDAKLRAVAAGLGGGLVAHFVFGLTDVIPLGAKVGVVFWLALGLAVACHHIVLADSPTSSTAITL
jgi:O-antigen ligase